MARCRGCKGEVTGVRAGFHARDPYCSEKCRVGGMQIVCRTCKAPAASVGDWRHCGACVRPPLTIKMRKVESELDQTINDGIAALTISNNVWNYNLAPKKEGGDAKRRKRA